MLSKKPQQPRELRPLRFAYLGALAGMFIGVSAATIIHQLWQGGSDENDFAGFAALGTWLQYSLLASVIGLIAGGIIGWFVGGRQDRG